MDGGEWSDVLTWRERNRLAGKCLLCSSPAYGGTIRCKHHRDLHNEQERQAREKRKVARKIVTKKNRMDPCEVKHSGGSF